MVETDLWQNQICRQCKNEIEKRQELIETPKHYYHVWCWELVTMDELRKENTSYSDTLSSEKQGEKMSEDNVIIVDETETPKPSLWNRVKKPLKWIGVAAGGAILGAVAVIATRDSNDKALLAGYEIGLEEGRDEDDSPESDD